MAEPISHPAEWSVPVKEAIVEIVAGLEGPLLDFYAGKNGLGFLGRDDVVGNELEPEWAVQIPHASTVGLAQELPFRSESFGAVVTSSPFFNRMGDSYMGNPDVEKCRTCDGEGSVGSRSSDDEETVTCPKCSGSGRSASIRRTYPIALGRQPKDGSTAALTWAGRKGKLARLRTKGAVVEAFRVLRPGGLLVWNIKDSEKTHYVTTAGVREGVVVRKYVGDWLVREALNSGFRFRAGHHVEARGYRFGANSGNRIEGEEVLVFSKPTEHELRWP